ncbi:endogenous retrovirus group 3 member 1 Env polyprotein-like [Rhinoderma darwinii]|uniref:endogenous retrovirus group 3 member 1 Env polyprotein-like n=1 Tax=Rhinoderma darwinii TaxID=43563 RepID=UPI003F680111
MINKTYERCNKERLNSTIVIKETDGIILCMNNSQIRNRRYFVFLIIILRDSFKPHITVQSLERIPHTCKSAVTQQQKKNVHFNISFPESPSCHRQKREWYDPLLGGVGTGLGVLNGIQLETVRRIEGNWKGECTLAKAIMPFHILSETQETTTQNSHIFTREKRDLKGSFDPHVYIDAIGVPRGVPDEFKARDQVAAGFESLIPMITVNKNVDWINYIYYNQQRFVNYTRDALQGLADQLGPTSTMTFQNRMALDMILAEKGGVCAMIGTTCCTFIPDKTGPNGKVTMAIKQIVSLSEELKRNSGFTDPCTSHG